MATQITVTVSDELLADIEAVAAATGRAVEAVLSERLEATRRVAPSPRWAHPDHAKMAREIAVYETLHPTLVRDHLGKYVAITGGALVDYDADRAALLARLEATHPGQVVLVRRVETELPADAVIPSVSYAPDEAGS